VWYFLFFSFDSPWSRLFLILNVEEYARTQFDSYVFITITSADGLLVPVGRIRLVVSALAVVWFIKYNWAVVVVNIYMVVGHTTTCAISSYHHYSCEFEPCSWQGELDTTLCDKICQWLATGLWFSPDTPVSSTNKTDRHNITEILLKVALNTITLSH